MRISINRVETVAAAATFVGALAFALPQSASGADTMTLAQAAGQNRTAAAPASTGTQKSAAEAGNERLQEIRQALKITPQQEPQFEAFAAAMRDNEKIKDAALQERAAKGPMNAVDDLRSYVRFTQMQAEAVNKLVPPFEQLYNTLSPDQKKAADQFFAKSEARAARRG